MSKNIFVTSYQPYEEGVRIKGALLRWRKKVLKALADGLTPNKIFYRSRTIPKEISDAVILNLENANTPTDVIDAFEKVIKHFLLGRIGVRPEDRNKPLHLSPIDTEITDKDVEDAIQDFDKWAEEHHHDLVGMLNAEIINCEDQEQQTKTKDQD